MKSKRGISPVVATVLLIVIAIVLFLLIFLWLRGFQKEAITKQGTPIETSCLEISFDTIVDAPTLQIVNTGDVPIYKAKVYYGNGGMTHLTDTDTIAQGSIVSVSIPSCTQIKIIPVLLGKTSSGVEREYVCENQAQIVLC